MLKWFIKINNYNSNNDGSNNNDDDDYNNNNNNKQFLEQLVVKFFWGRTFLLVYFSLALFRFKEIT